MTAAAVDRRRQRRVDVNAPIRVVEGRAPRGYSTVGDWVALSGASDLQCRVYWILRAHVNRKSELERDDSSVWPSQPTLAELVHVKKADTVSRAIGGLEALGAITVHTIATPTGRQNVYEVHLDPPEGFDGLRSLDDFYGKRKAERRAADKARRDEQLQAVRNSRSDSMTPPEGIPRPEGVPPGNGGRVTPDDRRPVTPGDGGKPQELKPPEGNGGRRATGPAAAAAPGRPPVAASSSSPIELDENDPDTWLCKTHRANPIPADEYRPPCGPCGRVRTSHERKAAQRGAERARAAVELAAACQLRGWCDGTWILDPATGDHLRPLHPCDHVTDPAPVIQAAYSGTSDSPVPHSVSESGEGRAEVHRILAEKAATRKV